MKQIATSAKAIETSRFFLSKKRNDFSNDLSANAGIEPLKFQKTKASSPINSVLKSNNMKIKFLSAPAFLAFSLVFALLFQSEIANSQNLYRSIQSGSWSLGSTWEYSTNGGLTWIASSIAPSSSDSSITIRSPHIVTMSSGTIITDQTVVDFGATLTLSADTITLNNGAGEDLVINGSMIWTGGGVVDGAGSMTISPGATCNLGNGLTVNTGFVGALNTTLTNNGTFNWSNVPSSSGVILTFNMSGGTINNNGAINADFAGSFNNMLAFTGGSLTNNSGGIINGNSSDNTLQINSAFINNGTINCNSTGQVYINYYTANTHSGVFNSVSSNGLVLSGSGTQTYDASSSFTGSGVINFANSTHNLSGSFTNTSPTISGGTVNFNQASVALSSMVLIGPGELSGTATKTISSSMVWMLGGTVSGGAITINNGATCSLGNGSNYSSSDYVGHLSASLTNNGTFSWSNSTDNSAVIITFDMTGGAINNNGVIDCSLLGTFSAMLFSGGTLNNNPGGIFNNNSPDNEISIGSILTNSGTINANSATTSTNMSTLGGNINVAPGAILNSGLSTFTGSNFINNGIVNSNASFTNGGTYKGNGTFNTNLFTNAVTGHVAPGNSPGCQTFNNGFTSLGYLDIEVNGTTTACTDYDKITVTGTATLSGTLNVTIGYSPANNDQVTFIAATTLSGTFATVNAPAGWSVLYNNPSTGMVSIKYCQQSREYRSVANGNWSSPSTWETYNGCIGWTAATFAPSFIDSTITIRSGHSVIVSSVVAVDQTIVAAGGILIVSSGTLQVADGAGVDLVVNGDMTFSGSFLEGAGQIDVSSGGSFDWTNGNMRGSGTTNFLGGSSVYLNSGGGSRIIGDTRTINNYGTVTWNSGTNSLLFANSVQFNNYGTFTAIADASFGLNGSPVAPAFNNMATGIFTKSSSFTVTIPGIAFNNSGAVFINDGTLALSSTTFTNFGIIQIGLGKTLDLLNTTTNLNSNTSITGSGNINLNGGTTNIQFAVQIPSGVNVNFSAGSIQGGNKLRFLNGAIMNWSGGDLSGNANTEFNPGSYLYITGNVGLRGNHYITNNGTINWNSAGNIVYDGGSTNSEILNNAIFNIDNSGNIVNTLGGSNFFTLTNTATGTINKTNSITTLDGNVTLSNSGTINISSGTLSLNMSNVSTQSGTFNISPAGTLSGTNSMTYTGSNFINNGNVSLSSNIINNGTYKGSGTYAGSVFFNNSSGVVAPGNSPGCQTFSNGFTSSGALNIEINGTTTACTDYDKITVTGTATIGGSTLNVTIGYTPANNDQVTFIAATTLSGTFATVNAPAGWAANYNSPSTGMVTLVYTTPASLNDYRTINSGTWETPAIWERYNGAAWVTAVAAPTNTDNVITIRSPHAVTINASRTIDQTVVNTGATLTVNAGTLTINNGTGSDFTINGSIVWGSATASLFVNNQAVVDGTASLNYNGVTLTNKGDINLPVTFIGTVAQTIIGTSLNSTSYGSITVNNANGITLNGATLTTSLLNFITGKITTLANAVRISAGGTITGADASTGYVVGGVQRFFNAGTSTLDYPVGSSSYFSPVSVTLNGVGTTAQIFVRNFGTDEPNISFSDLNSGKTVNTYWAFDDDAGTYATADVTFNWDAAQVDAGSNTANFGVAQYYSDASIWSIIPSSNAQPTSITTTGITTFTNMSYAVGEVIPAAAGDYRTINSGNWSNVAIWQTYTGSSWVAASGPPSSADNVITIRSGDNVTAASGNNVTTDQTIVEFDASLYISEATLFIVDGAGVDFECNGTLTINTAEFNVIGEAKFNAASTFNWETLSHISGSGVINVMAACDFNLNGSDDRFFENGITLNNYAACDINDGQDIIFDGATTTFNNYGAVNLNSSVDFIDNNANGHAFNNMLGGVVGSENSAWSIIDIEFNNYGLVDLVDGRISLNNTPTAHTGTYTLYSPGRLSGSGLLHFQGENITNNGTIDIDQLMYDTTGYQSISGNGSIANLYINNPDGVDLLGDQTITTDLNLLGGRIITGSNKLITADGATISNASGFGFIEGNLERYISVPGNVEYPIGDLANTAFITLGPSFTGAGFVEARTDEGDHQGIAASGIDSTKSLNRTWTITNNGLVFSECDVTFNWDGDEVDPLATQANFVLAKYDNPTWTLPSAVIPGANSLYVGNLTSFSEFQIGEPTCIVNIPDANFKNALLSNAAINTNSDGEIQCSEAAAYTGHIGVQGLGISDLTGIEAFTNITSLHCYNNQLTAINLSANTALTGLICSNNQLTSLNLSTNTALTGLACSGNQLTSLDLSNNTAIGSLQAGYNPLTSINLNGLTNLTFASLELSQLSSIDLSSNTNLSTLYLNDNQLTSLDVSLLTNLTTLTAQSNYPLTSINVQNGNNANLTSFDVRYTPILTCIQVDNVTAANGYAGWLKEAGASYSTVCPIPPCIVNIPDANFKNALLGNAAINTNSDGEIQCSEAAAYTGGIDVNGQSISDLTGIEAFTAATGLNASNNSIASVNLSSNNALTYLNFSGNQLASIDVSNLDGLTFLDLSFNILSTVDVSANTALTQLYLQSNTLTSIDVSTLTVLNRLNLDNNNLTALSVSNNTALGYLSCGTNAITSLNVSALTSLVQLYCYSNQLTSLNIKNGNNTNLVTLSATNNPNLYCIQVDDVNYMNTNWSSGKDAQASFNLDCGCTVNIPDANFKNALLANPVINLNSDGEIQCSEAAAYSGTINVFSSSISDLTGIEAFTSLIILNCAGNQLTTLDVSANVALTSLVCSDNQLSTLDVTANSALQYLSCDANQILTIDVSSNTGLIGLWCYNNQLASLNVSANTALQILDCGNNQFTTLDLSGNFALVELYCSNTLLSSLNIQNGNNTFLSNFDATGNPALNCIQVDDPSYMNANWSAGKDPGASFSINCTICIEADVPLATASSTQVCVGNTSTTLQINSGNLNNATAWHWYTGSCGGTPIGTGTSILVAPTDTTTYYVRGEGGCTTPGACGQITINVNPIPVPVISADSRLCIENGSVTLSVTDSVTNNLVTYLWSTGETTSTIVITAAGTYGVSVVSNGGCNSAAAPYAITMDTCFIPVVTTSGGGTSGTGVGGDVIDVGNNPATEDTTVYQIINGSAILDITVVEGKRDTVLGLLLSPAYGLTDIIDNGENELIITGTYPNAHINLLTALIPALLVKEIGLYLVPATNSVSQGITFSKGDIAMHSDSARKSFRLEGEGVKIGVLSNSYNMQPGDPAHTDVLNGDLPGTGNAYNTNPVEVLQEYPYRRQSDEGRAMLQIVHDIAPKAKLAFKTGILTAGHMADGIMELMQDTCNIIVDDISYIEEPFFQDGLVAQAVDNVTSQGVTYFTSSGNFGSSSYENTFSGVAAPPGYTGEAHNFANGFNGTPDIYQSVSFAPGIYTIALQWNEDFYSLGQNSGAISDLDIYLVDNNGNFLFGYNKNNIGGDPSEVLSFNVKGNAQANIMIVKRSGTANVRFKYVVFRGSMTINEYSIGESTVVGQANAAGAIAVGAVLYTNTPAFGVNTPTVASFSSRGGTAINGVVRNKPDFVAPNGINTTVNMGSANIDGDQFPNFFGTSCAAPHAAGVAALLLEGKRKFYYESLNSSGVKAMLDSTAIDMYTPGYDINSGYGFIQADAALRTFASPEPIIKELIYDSVNITPGTQAFNLTVVGSFFSPQSEIVLRGIHLTTSYNALTTNLTASIPTFTGNPAIQAYNPPISPSGFDGGLSEPVFFAPSLHHTVTVFADDKTKRFGEKLPVFTASTILIDNIPIANTGYTLADIGLDDMEFTSSATSTSNTGIYYIRPAHNLDPQDSADAVILDTYVYTFEDGLLTIEKLPLLVKPVDKTITYGDKIDGTEIEFTYLYDDSNILPGEQAALLNYLKTGYEPFIIKEVVMIDDRDEYNGDLLSSADLNNLSLMSGAQGRVNGSQGRVNGAQARVNTVGEPDTTFTIDLPFESLFNYNLHGNEANLTDSVMLQNGAQGRVNGSRGVVNAESLINGNEIINGAQGRVNGSQGRVNGAQGRVNGAQGRVNGDELDGQSNSNTATVIHESDLDYEIGNPNYEFLLYPINGITGLTAGSHWIIPAAFLDANLLVTYAPAALEIQPIEIKVSAENKSVEYGTPPSYTSEITGYQFDDSLANVFSGNISYSPASNSQINVGGQPIIPGAVLAQPSNYYLSTVNGNINVTPATLTITADNQNPLCSGLPVFTSTITGYQYSDNAANVLSTLPGYTVLNNLQQPVSGIPPVGIYEIVPGGAQLIAPSNYVLAYASGTLTEPEMLTLSATPTQPQCYGQTGSVVRTGSGGTVPYAYNATAITGLGTGTYNYTVTDANGCTASASVTITVPTAIVAGTSVTNSSCSANTGSANATATGGTPGYTYLWSNGQTTQSISSLANGTYTVTVKDSRNCTTTATATVIRSGSSPAIPATILGPVGVCRNQTGVVFSVAAVTGATSYTWTLPTGATGSSTTNSITLAFGGSYSTGNLSVKANNFCGSSANSTRSVPRLTAAPATPGTITGSASLCALTTQTYSVGSVTNATSYTWTVSTGLTITTGQNTATVTVSAAAGFASGTVSVKANNCIGSSSNSIKNVYGAITTAPVWQNGGNDNFTTEICGGSSHDYEIAPNAAATTRTWGAPSGCVISDKNGHIGNPLTVTGTDPAGEYEVTVTFPAGFVSGNITVYATNGCGNSPTASLAVQSKPNAPGAISGPTTNLCQKDNQVFSIAAVNGATTYTWTVPSGVTIKNNYGTSINVKFNSGFTGAGNITVKANNACGSSAVTSLSVSAKTVQPGSITGNASVCKSNTSVPYSIAAVTGATSYTWAITGGATFVGAATGASVNVRFTGATATSATLTAKANNACGSSTTSTKTITVNLSCRDIEGESIADGSISEIIVYPNPASDKLNITFDATGNEKYSIRLIDMIGNILLSETSVTQEGANLKEINIQNVSVGFYFLILQMDGMETKAIRVTVQ